MKRSVASLWLAESWCLSNPCTFSRAFFQFIKPNWVNVSSAFVENIKWIAFMQVKQNAASREASYWIHWHFWFLDELNERFKSFPFLSMPKIREGKKSRLVEQGDQVKRHQLGLFVLRFVIVENGWSMKFGQYGIFVKRWFISSLLKDKKHKFCAIIYNTVQIIQYNTIQYSKILQEMRNLLFENTNLVRRSSNEFNYKYKLKNYRILKGYLSTAEGGVFTWRI